MRKSLTFTLATFASANQLTTNAEAERFDFKDFLSTLFDGKYDIPKKPAKPYSVYKPRKYVNKFNDYEPVQEKHRDFLNGYTAPPKYVHESYEKRRPIVGYPITINCDDGSTVKCSSGTRDCYNNSPHYCSKPEKEDEIRPGDRTTINCPGGVTAECPSGVQDCRDNSEFYCPEQPQMEDEIILGGPITITCPGGETAECSSGTMDCFDNSPIYCPGKPEPLIPVPVPCRVIISCPGGITTDCPCGV